MSLLLLLRGAAASGGSTVSGALSSAGVGAATFVGASTFNGALSSSGVGAAAFVGASNSSAVLSSAGVGTASFVGATTASILVASGIGDAAFIGASTFAGVWSSSGTGTASFTPPPSGTVDQSDGKPRRHRTGDDELTEAEVQYMFRKLAELKAAKTEREKVQAAKALEIALAQAAQDEEAAEVISASIQAKDYGAVMRDVPLLTSITQQLDRIVKEAAAERRRLDDEDDIETILMAL